VIPIEIITCPQWGARKPKHPIQTVGAAERIIIHHTAGHHAEIENPADESRDEAMRYARDIQAFHMDKNGWIDSGHNFLVCRNGLILQGRWLTVSAIESGHMVDSAHCPGQNHNVGIEHEHNGTEAMTDAQRRASALLIAWISAHYDRHTALPLAPHREFFATACPANLEAEIPHLTTIANGILAEAPKGVAVPV
jgi:N-acetylmuramoyl-L-alanine amidase